MTISGITTGMPVPVKGAGFDIVIPGSKGFADTLTIGQIIKGRVLRHFGDNRYLVDFNGREHVVDSAVPLRTNDLIRGRVVGLGEQVELQHIAHGRQANEPQPTQTALGQNATTVTYSRSGQVVREVLANYNVRLSQAAQAEVIAAARAVPDPALMVRVAVALNRLGLPQSRGLLRAIYDAASHEGGLAGIQDRQQDLPVLGRAEHDDAGQAAEASVALASIVQQDIEKAINRRMSSEETMSINTVQDREVNQNAIDTSESSANDAQQEGQLNSGQADEMARWVLNAQSGGTVSHRVTTLSLLMGTQLVEVDVALFDQKGAQAGNNATRHRQVVMSLNTTHLGRVDITAGIAGDRLRLHVASATDATTEELVRYMAELREEIAAAGWHLDELAYETLMQDSQNSAVYSVIEHLISQDSLSRLM